MDRDRARVIKDLVRAQCETLAEWATLYEREADPGSEEISYLLRRAARLMARYAGIDIALGPEPREKEPSTTEAKEG